MQEPEARSLGQEDALGEGVAALPVFLPEVHGQRRLASYSLWGLSGVGQD